MAGGKFEFGGLVQTQAFAAGEPLVRIFQSGRSPVWFGPAASAPPANRFDAPNGQYRTLYAATSLTGAYVETALHRPAGRIVKRSFIESRSVAIVHPTRALTMATLHGTGLMFHDAFPALGTGQDYNVSRAFALALYEQFQELDGLVYRSSHNDDERCLALFDRVAADALVVTETTPLSDIPDQVDEIMVKHGAVFDTSAPVLPFKDLMWQEGVKIR